MRVWSAFVRVTPRPRTPSSMHGLATIAKMNQLAEKAKELAKVARPVRTKKGSGK